MEINASIIGYGRFGKVLERLLVPYADIKIFDSNPDLLADPQGSSTQFTTNLEEIYSQKYIFYAVPISQFENVIREHKDFIKNSHVLVDVLSVKVHSKNNFQKYIPEGVEFIPTHPMFGPVSAANSFEGLRMVYDSSYCSDENLQPLMKIWNSENIIPIEMSVDEHDKLVAYSQIYSFLIGLVLGEISESQRTKIDTKGAEMLAYIKETTASESRELVKDIFAYNPYSKKSVTAFNENLMKVVNEVINS